MTANERDSASALITQHFIKDIVAIALASQDGSALTATEVIASIKRQGLAHPKESGPALVDVHAIRYCSDDYSRASIATSTTREHV